MTIEEYFSKQTNYDDWEYCGQIDGVQLYVFKNKANKNAFVGFPHFVIDRNGKFSEVDEMKDILKYNRFYQDSFPDDPEERQ